MWLMARIRSVKPALRTSEVVARWPFEVRYAFVLLWGYLDDEGRGLDVPKAIAGDCFPHDDKVTPAVMSRWLDLMAKTKPEANGAPPLCRYEVAGRRYLHCPNWSEHQRPNRPTKSVIPHCPVHERLSESGDESSTEPGSESSLSRHVLEVDSRNLTDEEVDSRGIREAATERGRRGTRLPDDFPVTPEMVAWARDRCPEVDGKRETEKFVNYWRAKSGAGATKLDWAATWRNWMLKAAEQTPRGRVSPVAVVATSDERFNQAADVGRRLQERADAERAKEITA